MERENIVIDGAGYTIKGPGKHLSGAWGLIIKKGDVTITNVKIKECGIGIYVYYVENVMIYNNTVSNDFVGIEYSGGENSTISNNVFLNVSRGIVIDNSANNMVISGNNISADEYGILIGPIEGYSVNNVISCNIISDADAALCLMHNNYTKIVYNIFLSNNQGIRLLESHNNLFFHNNFINNLTSGTRFLVGISI